VNHLLVSWDEDYGWGVELLVDGEWEAATGDTAECYWLSFREALALARELGRKLGLRVAYYPRRSRAVVWLPTAASASVRGGQP